MKILLPLPARDFDPSEAAISWRLLSEAGHAVTVATPHGAGAEADDRMLTGRGLGIWKRLLMADERARAAYDQMSHSPEFLRPVRWEDLNPDEFDALILPGGHAPGMKEYLESAKLQEVVAGFIDRKPVGAICHGVVLASRSKRQDGRSILYGKRTTALLKSQELTAWALTTLWLGSYYRTYPETVQDEVCRSLERVDHFISGPTPIRRDRPENLAPGFVVRDGNYLSARWPGDAHRFGTEFSRMLQASTQ
jgi:protease I